MLVHNDYTYDPAGQRLTNQITSSDGTFRTEQYGYDELNRLTSVNYGDGETQGYSFDPMGNRLTKTDSVTGNESYAYNNANMLLTRNGASYTNDTNGNTLAGGGRTNTWDGENRLTQCLYNGTTSSFTYGSDGLRRRSVTGANTTDYVLDGDNAVRTLLNGAVDKTWLHGARGPEYERTGSSSPVWYLYDGLGSVLGTVDGSGTILSSRKYDVYGAVRASTGGAGSKHKFVGTLGHPSDDETGLVYKRARYYDPSLGRFITEDPAQSGRNWYAYSESNPTNKIDRDGKNPLFIAVLTAMLIGFVLACIVDALMQRQHHPTRFNVWEMLAVGAVGAVMAAVGVLTGAALAAPEMCALGSIAMKFAAASFELTFMVLENELVS